MDHVDVKGLRIGYERAGSGPPLVLLQASWLMAWPPGAASSRVCVTSSRSLRGTPLAQAAPRNLRHRSGSPTMRSA